MFIPVHMLLIGFTVIHLIVLGMESVTRLREPLPFVVALGNVGGRLDMLRLEGLVFPFAMRAQGVDIFLSFCPSS